MKNKRILVAAAALSVIILVIGTFYVVSRNNEEASKTCTTFNDSVQEQCIEDYIGLSEEEAIDKARRYRYNPQIVSVNGVGQGVNDIGGPNIRFDIMNGLATGGYFPN